MSRRVVIALGGNALGKNLHEQMEAVQRTSKKIVALIAYLQRMGTDISKPEPAPLQTGAAPAGAEAPEETAGETPATPPIGESS